MNEQTDKTNSTHWPYTSLLIFGYFGKDSPGGRTLFIRSMIGVFLCAIGIVMSAVFENPMLVIPTLTLVPVSVLIIMWAYKEYLAQLDELSRTIQYESLAFAYGITMVIGLSLYAFGVQFDTSISPIWILIAEGLRGIALTRIAKKYT